MLTITKCNLLCNFIEIALRHGCSPVNLLNIFRTPFPRNISGWLLLNIITSLSLLFFSRYFCKILYLLLFEEIFLSLEYRIPMLEYIGANKCYILLNYSDCSCFFRLVKNVHQTVNEIMHSKTDKVIFVEDSLQRI